MEGRGGSKTSAFCGSRGPSMHSSEGALWRLEDIHFLRSPGPSMHASEGARWASSTAFSWLPWSWPVAGGG